jgi:hypothetical protein
MIKGLKDFCLCRKKIIIKIIHNSAKSYFEAAMAGDDNCASSVRFSPLRA